MSMLYTLSKCELGKDFKWLLWSISPYHSSIHPSIPITPPPVWCRQKTDWFGSGTRASNAVNMLPLLTKRELVWNCFPHEHTSSQCSQTGFPIYSLIFNYICKWNGSTNASISAHIILKLVALQSTTLQITSDLSPKNLLRRCSLKPLSWMMTDGPSAPGSERHLWANGVPLKQTTTINKQTKTVTGYHDILPPGAVL